MIPEASLLMVIGPTLTPSSRYVKSYVALETNPVSEISPSLPPQTDGLATLLLVNTGAEGSVKLNEGTTVKLQLASAMIKLE